MKTVVPGCRRPTISGSAVEAQQSVATPNGPLPFRSDFFKLGFDASYEIDLYGRVGRSIEAARADAAAEAAVRDTVAISVAAETARAYADGCSAARQYAVAEQSLKLQSDSFDLTERRVAAGRDSPLDAARGTGAARIDPRQPCRALPPIAAARVCSASPSLPASRRPRSMPRAAACTACRRGSNSRFPPVMAPRLLKRRPDVRRADRQLAAATARIGVATADLYPRISPWRLGQRSGHHAPARFSRAMALVSASAR